MPRSVASVPVHMQLAEFSRLMRNRYFLLPLVTLLVACHQQPKASITRLTQQAYVWQRDWTPVVSKSVTRPLAGLDGLVVLGAQIRWRSGKPVVFKPNIDWAALRLSLIHI